MCFCSKCFIKKKSQSSRSIQRIYIFMLSIRMKKNVRNVKYNGKFTSRFTKANGCHNIYRLILKHQVNIMYFIHH